MNLKYQWGKIMLENLEPKNVFKYFSEISKIPRGSGNTKGIVDYLINFAKAHNLFYHVDEANNVIIKKAGKINNTIILQGHTDMVAVQTEDSNIDMKKDALDVYIDGEYIKAKNTSLGADDGIAVSFMLSILSEDSLVLPNIEAVFTSDEEIGLIGASKLDTSLLSGNKLINIDSEKEGVFTVSCAGGTHIEFSCKLDKEKNDVKSLCYEISINNLLGGHSGMEINKNRGNANVLIIRLLYSLMKKIKFKLVNVNGGSFDNVITKNSASRIVLDKNDEKEFLEFIDEYKKIYKNEFLISDKDINIDIKKVDLEDSFTYAETKNILETIYIIPNGMLETSQVFDNIPELSLNLGIIETKNNNIKLVFLIRSNVDSKRENLVEIVKSILLKNKFDVINESSYNAWQYKKDSYLREKFIEEYRKMYNSEPIIEGTHGGLECGLFMDKIKNLECISIGPNMYDVHSVNEKVEIKSVERVYKLLLNVLGECN